MIITLLGLGEAGRLYAEGFAESGAEVHGYDPFVTISSGAVEQHSEIAAAVAPANVVISLVGAKAAGIVGGQAFPYLAEGAVYADFNTASPSVKSELSVNAASAGVLFADVAVLAPVPRAGSRTPLMASGSGADELHRALSPLGVPIESIGGEAGAAASRKLLRSVFMKGLAGVVLEAAEAGRESGNEELDQGPDGRRTRARWCRTRRSIDRRKSRSRRTPPARDPGCRRLRHAAGYAVVDVGWCPPLAVVPAAQEAN